MKELSVSPVPVGHARAQSEFCIVRLWMTRTCVTKQLWKTDWGLVTEKPLPEQGLFRNQKDLERENGG